MGNKQQLKHILIQFQSLQITLSKPIDLRNLCV